MKLDIESFKDGYVQAMLWANFTDETGESEFNGTAADFSPKGIAVMAEDCESFAAEAGVLLEKILSPEYTSAQAGHDFALTRAHHGAGFWDRGFEDTGWALTEIAEAYGDAYIIIGDDGLLYQEG